MPVEGATRAPVDERPPLPELFLLGLQWTAIIIPIVIIIGRIVGEAQSDQLAQTVLFMRKTAFLIALTMGGQVLLGHRLPLVAGPASVLVVGVIASLGFSRTAINTSMMVGGLLLAIAAMTGLFPYPPALYTPRGRPHPPPRRVYPCSHHHSTHRRPRAPGSGPAAGRLRGDHASPYVLRIQALEGHLEVDTHPLVDRGGLVRMGPFLPGLERYGKGRLTSRFSSLSSPI